MSRHFFRCFECLSVSAIDTAQPLAYDFKALCGACHDPRPIEYMGEVKQNSLIKREMRTPCDDRCTSARGPLCECKCGGPNHGTHMIVEFIHVVGSIPIITPPSPISARTRAKEFRDAFNLALAQIPGQREYERKRAGAYLSPTDYNQACRGKWDRRRLRDIEKMRSHPARMKALRAILKTSPARSTQTSLFTGGTQA
jgi:hypothetical protein